MSDLASTIQQMINQATKVKKMAGVSVTGVGRGSEHMKLSVEKVIGPRWTEEKEKEFQRMKRQIGWMVVGAIFGGISSFMGGIAILILMWMR